jgi:hypothetical protein
MGPVKLKPGIESDSFALTALIHALYLDMKAQL